ncbi:MAG TPA: hypothetical protein VER12_13705 [Polyangiaceae bacterium]|nr:hypothetical protein [Polyangiaceae bacterium]
MSTATVLAFDRELGPRIFDHPDGLVVVPFGGRVESFRLAICIMPLPLRIVELIEQHPLETPENTAAALAGDLTDAARHYAQRAGRVGRDPELWNVWLAVQQERALDLASAIEELSAQERRWLAFCAFSLQADEVGIAAYSRYLREPGKIGPFRNETKEFLDALARSGRGAEAMQWVAELETQSDVTPAETLWAARWLLRQNDTEGAQARVKQLLERNRDHADAWAVAALIAAARGQSAVTEAKRAAERGLYDEELIAALRACLGSETWDQIVGASAVVDADPDQQLEAFHQNPGMSLEPSDAPTPHWYGGDDYVMPACAGCGHPIRQWFRLDLSDIPDLACKLPAWPSCPFLGCADCMVWMGRHDYLVHRDERRITLSNVALSLEEYGRARRTTPPLERRYARLAPIAITGDPFDLNLGAVVGGVPLWVQSAQQVFCPQCDEAMAYVGAMGTPDRFEPSFIINNESGFQYHFACNACGTLSVLPQWS